MKFAVKTILYVLACFGVYAQAIPAAHSAEPIRLYVSTTGDDHADGRSPSLAEGSRHGPFATLERARNELRKFSGRRGLATGAHVIVRGGIYELQDTFRLESQDSGTKQAPIVYRPYEGEEVVLSGGRKLNNCRTTDLGLISCDTRKLRLQKLDSLGLGSRMLGPVPPFEVFSNGERLQLTRWPNADRQAAGGDTWAYVTNAPKDSRKQFFYGGESLLSSWSTNEAVLNIWPGNDWFDQYVGIKNMDAGNFTLADPTTYPIQAGRRFSILNVAETLDAPGEWYYSTKTEELVIFPLPGSKQLRPAVSYLDTVIAMHNTQNVLMEGFIIENSRKTAVTVTGGQNNTIAKCLIRNTGGFGIHVNGGEKHTVVDSAIHDTGYGGLILRGGNRKTLAASNHRAIGNNIHNTGQLVRVGKAALHLEGVGNTGHRNRIHHTPGMAVLITGNNHMLELNDIHHACEESSDCGAVYTGRDWTFHGNVIRYNRIHDVYGFGMKRIDASAGVVEYATPHGARGVYLDDAASGFDVVGNVFYRIPAIMIQIGGGRDNTVDNNIFITSGYAIWMDARWPGFPWKQTMIPRLNAVPHKGPIWRERFPRLAELMENPHWPEGNRITRNMILGETPTKSTIVPFKYALPPTAVEINNNIVWNQGKAVKVEYRLLENGDGGVVDWATWQQETGLDKNSLLKEPHFVDSIRGDFTLQQISPARELGIKEIPLNDIAASDDTSVQSIGHTSPTPALYRFNLQ